ncbi:hypothetical protein SUGI_0862820 [Cryptomeria japonica]|nr:hypothetical protein SUGI_0862820 [Cryptomeria japonica]
MLGNLYAESVWNIMPKKTTLGKPTCNFKLADFEGKVCHLEFSQGGSFERLELAQHYLTHCSQSLLQTLTGEDQGQKVLLVLDNITEESIGEVTYYVQGNSCILLSTRSLNVLLKHFKIDRQSYMHVPSLAEDGTIGFLLERTSLEQSLLGMGAYDRKFSSKFAKRESMPDIVLQISRGMEHHHHKGIMHKDLKVSNVLIDPPAVP